jgi:hypothetical protein
MLYSAAVESMTNAAFQALAETGAERSGPAELLVLKEVAILQEAIVTSANDASSPNIEYMMSGGETITLWDPLWSTRGNASKSALLDMTPFLNEQRKAALGLRDQ